MWAAWDCFSSVFGFVLFLLFQKVEHTLKKETKGEEGKKGFKDPQTLSCVNYFFPLSCSVNIQVGLHNNKSDKTHFTTYGSGIQMRVMMWFVSSSRRAMGLSFCHYSDLC